ncbi:MAG: glycosyltransferase family 4 protein [Roseofilum sp. SBFL]|uniref:glycosyltransferase family 4 protein n=1 Tax=unclassified Roseofilum TaxID=2620099 RepID=UPI001B23CAEE|nr:MULTISPECIES: glycosyltransferase family 4 protein [unclassified Roseofilum]MBP0014391.1 glycosyltransferase family 4 protein [Roseofilum sp. SID3]MBP0025956.1 glycosyltransferase family 4 protein [Roseofilum sp. SID2]MBP0036128.1 glycosyltransferase family 4 protein [Roseofilum sp. SID1]MBP0040496.1 glycosyltransferase family 4 protein [Roseofilum sp. SBFL]
MDNNKSLRILMILHMPWDRNLGGSRVQLELADEFWKMGHHIEKFDINDAFPNGQSSRLAQFTRPSFSSKAKEFAIANGHRFDIIDAHQGNLPFTKQELKFKGLLVARSVGLYAFCEEYFKLEQQKWPQTKQGNPITNTLRSWRQMRERPYYVRSLETCDLINLPNEDEKIYVQEHWGLGDKCSVFPFGLSEKRQQLFTEAVPSTSIRLNNKQVVFIGYWGKRKGSRDWAEIIHRTKAKISDVKFKFLGTGLSAEEVLQDLNLLPSDWIEIIPKYDSDELPSLLSGTTVGAFPSYMEGFGFAVLEKIACGLPTVAYDIPGPREMLKHVDPALMVPVGDVNAFVEKLVSILTLERGHYEKLCQQCLEVVKNFSWPKIAAEQIQLYSQCYTNLN